MPRKLNPGTLKTGHGKQAPSDTAPQSVLDGAGMAGAGPNIGQTDKPPGSPSVVSVSTHISAFHDAHPAAAITHDSPVVLGPDNVDEALKEFAGTVVQRPPMLGEYRPDAVFDSIPDWGRLRLGDGAVPLSDVNAAGTVFPYYYAPPSPAIAGIFSKEGDDPSTDPFWNTGSGRAFVGAYTRDGDTVPAADLEVMRTARLLFREATIDAETGLPERDVVTVSGTIFPADRGVLALLHFPPSGAGTFTAEFLAQPLLDRCIAALLMGGGVLGAQAVGNPADCPDVLACDGQPGGVFGVGVDADNHYDPFAFPGRATGQYDLLEIHNGTDTIHGNDLISPWDDLDVDTNAGWKRNRVSATPTAGQVRLGTDPNADPISGTIVVDYGIPVLGGTGAAYNAGAEQPQPFPGSDGSPGVGNTLITNDAFFSHRLPVLKDYSPTTGLRFTARGEDATATRHTDRYFAYVTPTAAAFPDGSPLAAVLPTAGLYTGFDEDYWSWQIARFRHFFWLPSTQTAGDREEVGSYWLVHFKSEANFEACVRDGVFPWDATDGYEVFGTSLASTAVPHVEEDGNVANVFPGTIGDAVPPAGPAPDYGYAAQSYHPVRSTIIMDPAGRTIPAASGSYDWGSSAAADDGVMWISGVSYFTPRRVAAGAGSFSITDWSLGIAAGFWTTYRSDDTPLTALNTTPPALLSSLNPAFVGLAPFAYDDDGGTLPLSVVATTNTDPTLGVTSDPRFIRKHRIEFPFTHCGTGGFSGTPFSDINGPLDTDLVAIAMPAGEDVVMVGDDQNPSFTRDAVVRSYFRRPLNNSEVFSPVTDFVQPHTAAGGHGHVLTSVPAGTIHYHSGRFDKTNLVGRFSNHVNGVLAFAGTPFHNTYPALFVEDKDTCERFLDEQYRLLFLSGTSTINTIGSYTVDTDDALEGPGMGAWVGGAVQIPVRIGHAANGAGAAPGWHSFSWVGLERHTLSLDNAVAGFQESLQVVGLPDRNPNLDTTETADAPFPSQGMVVYPQKDHLTGTFPTAPTHQAQAQPDYTTGGLTYQGTRGFVRVLDMAFINHGGGGTTPPVTMAGKKTVVLRFDGVTLDTFQYVAPGPGSLGEDFMALYAKVPGLTTWMDIGRVDGGGPSKQDPALDGAGCKLLGASTYDFVDPQTGMVGCYVEIHVGPSAAFFANDGTLAVYQTAGPTNALGEVPLMVKVEMTANSTDFNLERKFIGNAFVGASEPGLKGSEVRGLSRMCVVHPTATLVTSSAAFTPVIVP